MQAKKSRASEYARLGDLRRSHISSSFVSRPSSHILSSTSSLLHLCPYILPSPSSITTSLPVRYGPDHLLRSQPSLHPHITLHGSDKTRILIQLYTTSTRKSGGATTMQRTVAPDVELGKTNGLNEKQMATIMKAIGLSAPFSIPAVDMPTIIPSALPSFTPSPTSNVDRSTLGIPLNRPSTLLGLAPYSPADTNPLNPPPVPGSNGVQVNSIRDIIYNLSSEEKQPSGIPAQPGSRLLSIPGELRNRIYRLAIIEPDSIIIDRTSWASHQPALLKTCKQIRVEALPLFYVESKISADIHHWNPVAKDRVNRLMMSYNIKSPHVYYYFSGLPNWTNLLAWLKAVYEERAEGIATCVGEQKPLHRKTIGVMFLMVSKARGNIPWSDLVELLDAQRELLGVNDPQWLV